MKTGIIKFYNTEKGYGFIIDEESKKEIFCHATAVTDEDAVIYKGKKVSYETKEGKKGIEATNVVVLNN